jgi:predicted NBD/HSP70 family sugar kinase
MKTTSDIRKQNILSVLRALSHQEHMTKNDVASETGLTVMTVNTLMNGLLCNGLIKEDGSTESVGGRPAFLYRLNTEKFYLAGVDIHLDGFTIQICDLGMQPLYLKSLTIEKGRNSIDVLGMVKAELERKFADLRIPRESLLGIGVVFPAVVDTEEGLHSLFQHSRMWEGSPVKQYLKQEFGTKILVEKDTFASVLCLKRQFGDELRNAVSVIINGGIGGGILVDGKIFRGENGVAGEFGHMCMVKNGLECRCGDYGCLEMYASDIAVISRATQMLHDGKDSVLSASTADGSPIDIDMVVKGYNEGDPLCQEVLDNAAEYLCAGLCNIIKLYDPSHIILASVWVKQAKTLADKIEREISKKCNFQGKSRVTLHCTAEKHIHVNGAINLVYDTIMNNIESNPFVT